MDEPETELNSSESTLKPSRPLSKRQQEKLKQLERLMKDPDAPHGRFKNGAPRGKTGPKPKETIHPADLVEYNAKKNDERVMQAIDLMRAMKYEEGKTPRELAKKWGVSDRYARDLCARAAKVVREEVLHSDIVGATLGEALMSIVKQGMNSKKFNDRKLVIMAARVMADLSPGLKAPSELRVGPSGDGLPDDPAVLLEMARKKVAELEAGPSQSVEYVAVEVPNGSDER